MLQKTPPRWWPHFTSPLRSVAVTARVGRVLGIAFGICFVTGLLSHYQYQPWSWLPEPASPVWGYRLTQGLHVITGIATIPLLLVKLWSVFPKLFTWPPARSLVKTAERLSIGVLVSSALVELVTGFLNVLNWYAWPWSFVPVHRFIGYVVIGSILLHVAVKLPDIKRGLAMRVAVAPTLTEQPDADDPDAAQPDSAQPDGAAEPAPVLTPALSRRGLLAATGAGIGVVVVTVAGQAITPLQSIGLLAVRKAKQGPAGVPVNRTAHQAHVLTSARSPDWRLTVVGPSGSYRLDLADIARLSVHEADFPISCVEGWSVGAHWRGLSLLDVIRRVGGDAGSRVQVTSLENRGSYRVSYVDVPQLSHALLATHLNGTRIDINHGYPLRLIAPNRAGVLNTKWLRRIEVI